MKQQALIGPMFVASGRLLERFEEQREF